MEESNAWRNPVDLIKILESAFDEFPKVLARGRTQSKAWSDREILVPVLLGDDPQAIADALLDTLREGANQSL